MGSGLLMTGECFGASDVASRVMGAGDNLAVSGSAVLISKTLSCNVDSSGRASELATGLLGTTFSLASLAFDIFGCLTSTGSALLRFCSITFFRYM